MCECGSKGFNIGSANLPHTALSLLRAASPWSSTPVPSRQALYVPSDACSSIQLLPCFNLHKTSSYSKRKQMPLSLGVSLGRRLCPHILSLVFSYGHVHTDGDVWQPMQKTPLWQLQTELKATGLIWYTFL